MTNESNNDTPSKKTALAVRSKSTGSFLSTINNMEQFDKLVDFVASSKTYNNNFLVNAKDQDGNMERVVDRSAIATCLILGTELGFKPMEAIMLGKRLNDTAIIKIHKGRNLGIDAISSMQNIYVFDSGNGTENVYTSIHVINKVLTDNWVRRDIIDNGTTPFYYYVDSKTKEEVEFNPRVHVCINTGISAAELKAAMEEKKDLVLRKSTRRGLVRLTRKFRDINREDESIEIPYTLLQATDAGLYKGINSSGEEVKGKSNWNNHPATHVVKMSVMLGSRMLVGDKLQGTYADFELPVEDINYEEV